ncbi:MAG TPA: hypothetical protein VHB79_13960 [Polyangiaceae bacterium]|nr:hypothetical protein [Polyangiaceae bacterium]
MASIAPSPAAPTTLLERPPPGPARGPVGAPVWVVVLVTLALVLLAALSLRRAWRRRLK